MIALTTIPMPKDVIYPFEMPSYGSIATCEAQGFIFLLGSGLVNDMNIFLNIYYMCTLKYKMQEKTFRKYLEIPLYIVSLMKNISMPSLMIKQELLNPSPAAPICVTKTYPVDCTKADNPECRGEGGVDVFNGLVFFTTSVGFAILLITMILIVHSFYRNERKLRKTMKDNEIQEGDEAYLELQNVQEVSSLITRQALLYVAAFLIPYLFPVLNFVYFAEEPSDTILVLRSIFYPLQGFFNLFIFVYHKVQNLRRADEDLKFAEALGIVFLHPDEIATSILQMDNLDVVLQDISRLGRDVPENNVADNNRLAVNSIRSSDLSDNNRFAVKSLRSSDLSGFEDDSGERGERSESEGGYGIDIDKTLLRGVRGVHFQSRKPNKSESSSFIHSEGLSSQSTYSNSALSQLPTTSPSSSDRFSSDLSGFEDNTNPNKSESSVFFHSEGLSFSSHSALSQLPTTSPSSSDRYSINPT